jgi:hypothetical protein
MAGPVVNCLVVSCKFSSTELRIVLGFSLVAGQVVNVLREHNMPSVPGYRAQLTSHIRIPAVYRAGITLFVRHNSPQWRALCRASELPLLATDDDDTLPGVTGMLPGVEGTMPPGNEIMLPGHEGTLPPGDEGMLPPGDEDTMPGDHGTLQVDEDMLPGDEDVLLGDEGMPPGDEEETSMQRSTSID